VTAARVLRFGDFCLDTERHLLTRAGQDVPLSPHLVDILQFLVQSPGELVTKEALLDRFWRDVHVTENTVTRAVADIRKALGDDATRPQYIQTLARRGYRFIAHVTERLQEDADPFRDIVQGRAALESLSLTRLPAARRAFAHAVAVMPQHAPAHAGLASACLLQFESTRAFNVPAHAELQQALTHARLACELDPQLGEAWATLGFVQGALGDLDAARAATRRAIALEPRNWRHHFRLAIVSWGEERLRACDRAATLLPSFAPIQLVAGMVFVARQAFTEARAAASLGGTAQSHHAIHDAVPFPMGGLHWLRGLLSLQEQRVATAIQAFAQEIDELRDDQIYAAEFKVNAQVGAGFAHLLADDAAGAVDAFRLALEIIPRHGRALVGLYSALQRTSLRVEARQLIPQVDRAVDELTTGHRLGEAQLLRAAVQIAQGELEAAVDTLSHWLEAAPPGPSGWLLPIDPVVAPLRSHPRYPSLMALVAARAA
jgi:DNA-binding winged helix-turn-helix (wHTH) protein/Flp pilus assembly protein TadD